MIGGECEIIVPECDAGGRVDKFLSGRLQNVSRMRIKKSCDGGLVTCGGVAIPAKHIVHGGDSIKFRFETAERTTFPAEKMPLDVIFEDAHMIAINKPAGIVVHPGSGTTAPTLVAGVLAHCPLSTIGSPLRCGVVHRLDKMTSGAILFAKTDVAHLRLVKMFAERRMKKTYDAIVCGTFEKNFGEISAPIARSRVWRTKMAVSYSGKEALTRWSVAEKFGKLFTHLRINILTGRTHQIRVHMANARHPICGDITYGYDKNHWQRVIFGRVMLHASSLSLEHPLTGNEINLLAPLAEDFENSLVVLRKNFRH
jgi:23S rRNA pseudouridine1911/1915/1917 synthase